MNKNKTTKAKENQKSTAPVSSTSILGCDPSCPFFPRSIGGVVNWVYDEKEPWIKRRAKPKKFVCQYDGSIIKCWDKQPCPKKIDELATMQEVRN